MPPKHSHLAGYALLCLVFAGLPAQGQEQSVQVTLSDAVRTEFAAGLGLAADIIATQVSLPPEAAAAACGLGAEEITGAACTATVATGDLSSAVTQAIEAGAAEK